MTSDDIERAWRDRFFRSTLSSDELDAIPEHPSGAVELPTDVLGSVAGGTTTPACVITTIGVSETFSCSVNCDTIVRGSCGAFSYGCCSTPDRGCAKE